MNWITEEFIKENINYIELIEELKQGFREDTIECPPKLAYDYKSNLSKEDNTLLFMPAWDNQKYFGVKLITATPYNKEQNLPYLNGLYMLFNAENGEALITMDAKLITNMRTAATSVLASNYLAKKTSSSVLILGNGSLSPFYIEAYASNPSIDTVYLWGRNFEKSQKVVNSIYLDTSIKIEAIEDFSSVIKNVDVVSCITSSYKPLVNKEHLSVGQHYDLAGSYTEDMQEVSTDVVANCSVYTDNYNITLEHAGELVNAMKENKMSKSDVNGDLKFLCKNDALKRKSEDENTLFKCTGMAIEDLVIASLIFKKSNTKK